MKLIIAGSRGFRDYEYLCYVLNEFGWRKLVTVVVSGGAIGADTLGENWADENGIPKERFLPDYDTYGRYLAPKMRNREMAKFADRALVFWDGLSGGSSHLVATMEMYGKPVKVTPVDV